MTLDTLIALLSRSEAAALELAAGHREEADRPLAQALEEVARQVHETREDLLAYLGAAALRPHVRAG